jgi:hypothetical protein
MLFVEFQVLTDKLVDIKMEIPRALKTLRSVDSLEAKEIVLWKSDESA